MSETVVPSSDELAAPAVLQQRSFVAHAKLIGFFTLISRILGMARESVSAHYFGTGVVAAAFTVAFAIPNLFRKLFGEGALSAAFIPLYAQAIKTHHEDEARRFAAASVNLLCIILVAITIIGELIIFGLMLLDPAMRPDRMLTLKLTAIMLPYVLMICGTAFLSSILQVHRRFGAPAAAPILLNAVHIVVIVLGARIIGLSAYEQNTQLAEVAQTRLAFWLAFFVLVAGVGQILLLWPSLRGVGFRFEWVRNFWTPQVRKMLIMSVPVALGAGVLQISVLMDKAISLTFAQAFDSAGNLVTHFHIFGQAFRYPMDVGAAARLNLAQFLYQFPLGVFAIALATAIFPSLSADALDLDRGRFKSVLRQGIAATMFEGLAASAGLILVRYPCIRLLFEHGKVTPHDTELIARSLLWYATAIWAFSLLQIVNRAYYALHDTTTPLVMAIVNIVLNLVVELPLVWMPAFGEAGMAVGTSVSFTVQAIVMLYMLDRRVGGIGLGQLARPVAKMLIAMALMIGACLLVRYVPGYPTESSRGASAGQLAIQVLVGAIVYCGACSLMGVEVLNQIMPKRLRRRAATVAS
ncbi:MAG: murein biosynthesis integral membrane protein MurJ [Anaerolineae bacterium]|nr:murein biosynthesis integral membrane protein MurJ [Phycisphaerae bacterium]